VARVFGDAQEKEREEEKEQEMKEIQWVMETKLTRLYLVASETGLRGVHWKKQKAPMARSLAGTEPEIGILKQAVRELGEYLEGKRKTFDVRLDAHGTPFQLKVWKELARIPYGKTCSYADIAARVKKPTAVRAVGAANGRNPLSIIVPCHRVISSSGALTGYSGGLGVKSRLLELEGVRSI
jgi:methylated-DNA-[protein]-cysteine S-methyltransferase